MHAIRLDVRERGPALTRVVLLGDIIDRGPASAQVVRSVMRYATLPDRFVALFGNHEQLMVKALEGDQEALAFWLGVGGGDTLESFGVDGLAVREGASDRLLAAAQRAVGSDIVAWLQRMPLKYRSGEVVFVHAGLRPDVALDRQDPQDLLWIREPFLSDPRPYDFLVVHGHTIYSQGPHWGEYRIGVDTGAYETGRLTAVGLEDLSAWSVSSE